MREATWIEKLLTRICNLFSDHRFSNDEENLAMKREMCRRAIKSGVCPKSCNTCAWDIGEMPFYQ